MNSAKKRGMQQVLLNISELKERVIQEEVERMKKEGKNIMEIDNRVRELNNLFLETLKSEEEKWSNQSERRY